MGTILTTMPMAMDAMTLPATNWPNRADEPMALVISMTTPMMDMMAVTVSERRRPILLLMYAARAQPITARQHGDQRRGEGSEVRGYTNVMEAVLTDTGRLDRGSGR